MLYEVITGISGTVMDIRLIMKVALENLSSSIILYHNHPSGNCKPSDADREITKRMREVGKIMDIPVLDHIIVANNTYYSFSDEGLIWEFTLQTFPKYNSTTHTIQQNKWHFLNNKPRCYLSYNFV